MSRYLRLAWYKYWIFFQNWCSLTHYQNRRLSNLNKWNIRLLYKIRYEGSYQRWFSVYPLRYAAILDLKIRVISARVSWDTNERKFQANICHWRNKENLNRKWFLLESALKIVFPILKFALLILKFLAFQKQDKHSNTFLRISLFNISTYFFIFCLHPCFFPLPSIHIKFIIFLVSFALFFFYFFDLQSFEIFLHPSLENLHQHTHTHISEFCPRTNLNPASLPFY